jgi:Alcohol dehydrogenase transcription factor Myb/SANT-like
MAKYKIEDLIESVKRYPALYCKSSNTVTLNVDEKNSLWANIAKELNDNPVKVKQKWRNLRDSYQKAMKTKKDLEEMGQIHRYHEYRHEHSMSFLLPHIVLSTTDSSIKRRKSRTYSDSIKK